MSDLSYPEFDTLLDSWDLALHADGYPVTTRRSYGYALKSFTEWLAEHADSPPPGEVTRDHVRGWVIHVRETKTSNTARTWLSGVRHFFKWAIEEQEVTENPALGVKMPPPGETRTPVVTDEDVRKLFASCAGRTFVDRRDNAILRLFFDAGPRLAELAGLEVDDIDLRERIVYLRGKGARRSGPRLRAAPFGVKTAQALDRYLRERRKHPHAHSPKLWLGARNRGPISREGVDAILDRRSAACGIRYHAHMSRHTWASAFRMAGGNEGDLMVMGGWRSRQMLDRYGKAAEEDRAREAYRRLSFGDRL